MAWRSSGSSNESLVDNLVKNKLIESKVVEQTMKKVDRAKYCKEAKSAYEDSPQVIGYNATISAPHMHAMCLELLKDNLKPGCKALDVGSGSGYLTACMGVMVGAEGHAYGVEHIPQLVEWSRKNIAADLGDCKHIEILQADGRLGLPDKAPFDCIHVGAAAEAVPDALVQQLKTGGRLVIPVGPKGDQALWLIEKKSEKEATSTRVTGVSYIPLTSQKAQLGVN